MDVGRNTNLEINSKGAGDFDGHSEWRNDGVKPCDQDTEGRGRNEGMRE